MHWVKRLFGKGTEPTLKEMADHLLDKSAEFGDRDDLAMALGDFDSSEAEETLLQIVSDESEDEDIVESAAESLRQIWERQQRSPDAETMKRMHTTARRYFSAADV